MHLTIVPMEFTITAIVGAGKYQACSSSFSLATDA
jgi:hypothetical protein